MENIRRAFMMFIKIFLILIGSVMLLGGGICAATNTILGLQNLSLKGDSSLFLLLFVISVMSALMGCGLIWLSGITKPSKFGKNTESSPAKDLDKHNE